MDSSPLRAIHILLYGPRVRDRSATTNRVRDAGFVQRNFHCFNLLTLLRRFATTFFFGASSAVSFPRRLVLAGFLKLHDDLDFGLAGTGFVGGSRFDRRTRRGATADKQSGCKNREHLQNPFAHSIPSNVPRGRVVEGIRRVIRSAL